MKAFEVVMPLPLISKELGPDKTASTRKVGITLVSKELEHFADVTCYV